MRPIRSLLWIGSGGGLAESGVTEAPELDVTWVPNLDEALALPHVIFDGILLEATRLEELDSAFASLRHRLPRTALLVSLPARHEQRANEILEAGASDVFYLDADAASPGIVSQVGETLDAVHEARLQGTGVETLPPALPTAPANAAV